MILCCVFSNLLVTCLLQTNPIIERNNLTSCACDKYDVTLTADHAMTSLATGYPFFSLQILSDNINTRREAL